MNLFISSPTLFPVSFSPVFSYFAQILEEHGPLEVSDPLLVGELKNFPLEAQQKIDAAGGLEHFLLGSLRFVMHGHLVGLTLHAVGLQHNVDDSLFPNFPSHSCSFDDSEPKGSSYLNPTAKEFLPQLKHLSLEDSSESYDHATCPVLPSPYAFVPSIPLNLNGAFELTDTATLELDGAECLDYFPGVLMNALNTEVLSSDNYINLEDACPKSKTSFVQVRSFKNH